MTRKQKTVLNAIRADITKTIETVRRLSTESLSGNEIVRLHKTRVLLTEALKNVQGNGRSAPKEDAHD